jgi:non-canonical purine NTP pyrophosphatase (RdgB/HAM1 family)
MPPARIPWTRRLAALATAVAGVVTLVSSLSPNAPARERLLEALERIDGEGRRARYVCELVAVAPDGREVRGTGVLEGWIAREPRGSEGFGYDPIFVPEGEQRTVAELGNDWKRENSHRARAARDLMHSLREPGNLL